MCASASEVYDGGRNDLNSSWKKSLKQIHYEERRKNFELYNHKVGNFLKWLPVFLQFPCSASWCCTRKITLSAPACFSLARSLQFLERYLCAGVSQLCSAIIFGKPSMPLDMLYLQFRLAVFHEWKACSQCMQVNYIRKRHSKHEKRVQRLIRKSIEDKSTQWWAVVDVKLKYAIYMPLPDDDALPLPMTRVSNLCKH